MMAGKENQPQSQPVAQQSAAGFDSQKFSRVEGSIGFLAGKISNLEKLAKKQVVSRQVQDFVKELRGRGALINEEDAMETGTFMAHLGPTAMKMYFKSLETNAAVDQINPPQAMIPSKVPSLVNFAGTSDYAVAEEAVKAYRSNPEYQTFMSEEEFVEGIVLSSKGGK